MDPKRVPKLGEILVQKGFITWDQLEEALQTQMEASERLKAIIDRAHTSNPKPLQVFTLGEILIRHGWVTWEHMTDALKIQESSGRRIGEILLDKNYITAKNLHKALAIQHNMSFVDFEKIKVPEEVLRLVPKNLACGLHFMPLVIQDLTLLIAIADPKDIKIEPELRRALPGYEILTALALENEIKQALWKYYGPV